MQKIKRSPERSPAYPDARRPLSGAVFHAQRGAAVGHPRADGVGVAESPEKVWLASMSLAGDEERRGHRADVFWLTGHAERAPQPSRRERTVGC